MYKCASNKNLSTFVCELQYHRTHSFLVFPAQSIYLYKPNTYRDLSYSWYRIHIQPRLIRSCSVVFDVFFGQTHTLLLVWRHRYNTWQLRCVQCACSPLQILSQNLTRFITTSQPPGCPCFFLQWSYLETASQAKNMLFIWKWTVNDVIFSEENYGLRFAAFVSDPSNSVLQCWLLNDVITP